MVVILKIQKNSNHTTILQIPSSVNVNTNQDWKNYMDETIFDFNFIRGFDKILFSNSTFFLVVIT